MGNEIPEFEVYDSGIIDTKYEYFGEAFKRRIIGVRLGEHFFQFLLNIGGDSVKLVKCNHTHVDGVNSTTKLKKLAFKIVKTIQDFEVDEDCEYETTIYSLDKFKIYMMVLNHMYLRVPTPILKKIRKKLVRDWGDENE